MRIVRGELGLSKTLSRRLGKGTLVMGRKEGLYLRIPRVGGRERACRIPG